MDFSEQQHYQYHYQHQESSATAAIDPSQSQSYDPYSSAYLHYQHLHHHHHQQYYDCSSTQTYAQPDPAAAVAALSQLPQFAGAMADRERHENGGPYHHPYQHPQHNPMEDGQTSIQPGGGGGRMGGGPFRGGRRGKGPFKGGGGGRGNSSHLFPRQEGGAPASFRSRGRGRMGRGGGKKQHQTAPGSQPALEQSSAAGGGKQQALPVPAPPHNPLLPIAWCDICRVDCNSLQILEQHKNGKRHRKTVQRLDEIQKKQKLFAELQAKAMPDMILPGTVLEKVAEVEVGEVRKVSSAPEDITTAAVLSAQVVEVAETSDTIQMDDANKTYNPESKPAVVLTGPHDSEPQVEKVQTVECQLEPAKVGGVTDAPPPASSVAKDHLSEGSKEPPSSDSFDRRRGGMKRKMTVGRGRKRLKGSELVQGQAPERPKERPRVCTLCSVMCESLVVFESHLAGKKHLSKIKRFQGQGSVYGHITAYIPPNQPSTHPTPGREPLFFGLMNHEMLHHETHIRLNSLQAENHGFDQGVQGDHNRGAEGGDSEPHAMEGLENLEGGVIPANGDNVVITDNAENQDTAAAFALRFEAKEPHSLPPETTISDTEAAIRVAQDALRAPEFSSVPGDDGVLPSFDTKVEQPTANSKQLTNGVEMPIQ